MQEKLIPFFYGYWEYLCSAIHRLEKTYSAISIATFAACIAVAFLLLVLPLFAVYVVQRLLAIYRKYTLRKLLVEGAVLDKRGALAVDVAVTQRRKYVRSWINSHLWNTYDIDVCDLCTHINPKYPSETVDLCKYESWCAEANVDADLLSGWYRSSFKCKVGKITPAYDNCESWKVYVLTGASGAGKTTLADAAVAKDPERRKKVVTYTTREPRLGEMRGVDYHFVTHSTFRKMKDAGAFMEWAPVHDHYYGTTFASIAISSGNAILVVDVAGARAAKKRFGSKACYIYIEVPITTLVERLRARGDSEKSICARVFNAQKEIAEIEKDVTAGLVDATIVNDDLRGAESILNQLINT